MNFAQTVSMRTCQSPHDQLLATHTAMRKKSLVSILVATWSKIQNRIHAQPVTETEDMGVPQYSALRLHKIFATRDSFLKTQKHLQMSRTQ